MYYYHQRALFLATDNMDVAIQQQGVIVVVVVEFFLCFETGSLYVDLAPLELTMSTRLTSNSQKSA